MYEGVPGCTALAWEPLCVVTTVEQFGHRYTLYIEIHDVQGRIGSDTNINGCFCLYTCGMGWTSRWGDKKNAKGGLSKLSYFIGEGNT